MAVRGLREQAMLLEHDADVPGGHTESRVDHDGIEQALAAHLQHERARGPHRLELAPQLLTTCLRLMRQKTRNVSATKRKSVRYKRRSVIISPYFGLNTLGSIAWVQLKYSSDREIER